MEPSLSSILQDKVLPAAFPGRLEVRLSPLQRIAEGWESEIYAFRMEYRLPGEAAPAAQELILRIYPGDDLPAAARKAEGEARALRLLGQAGYPVPAVF